MFTFTWMVGCVPTAGQIVDETQASAPAAIANTARVTI